MYTRDESHTFQLRKISFECFLVNDPPADSPLKQYITKFQKLDSIIEQHIIRVIKP